MTDQNSQATPQEPVIPEGGQVPEFTPAQPGSTQPEPQTEVQITPEMVRQWAREEATKISQSQVAKGENRIRKEIQDKFAALDQTRSALNLSDQQVADAKQKIVADAYSSPEEEPQTSQPQSQPGDNTDQAIQFMNTQIGIVFSEVGQAVTKSDPEFADLQKTIDAAFWDPNGLAKILTAANKAATAKTARLQRSQQSAPGRVIGAGQPSGGQAQPRPASAHDAWSEAYNKQ